MSLFSYQMPISHSHKCPFHPWWVPLLVGVRNAPFFSSWLPFVLFFFLLQRMTFFYWWPRPPSLWKTPAASPGLHPVNNWTIHIYIFCLNQRDLTCYWKQVILEPAGVNNDYPSRCQSRLGFTLLVLISFLHFKHVMYLACFCINWLGNVTLHSKITRML